MKHIQIDLPDKIAQQIEMMVRDGWFQDEGELLRTAILEFLQNRNQALTEEFQREDIAWALQQKADRR
jgi:Arc/MetJ-type ribon-helix-helix transcriptional regulator